MSLTASAQRVGRFSNAKFIFFAGFVVLITLVASLAFAEVTLRLFRDVNRFYPYHRNAVKIFYPSESITPGVSGVSRFTTNSLGTRGPELAGERIRILTIGGSTTACTVLDDSETWPFLLMRYLNEDAGDVKFAWVTNSGVDGHNSHHHMMHAKYLIPQLPRLDYVIIYAGVNDVGMWLYKKQFDPNYLDNRNNWNSRIGEAFRVSNFTPADWPWYKHFEIWKRASIAKNWLISLQKKRTSEDRAIVQDANLRWMAKERRRRNERSKTFVHRAKMATLPVALDSFANNLKVIIKSIRDNGAEPILMAQAMQHHFLNEEERRQLWMGAMDGGDTYVKEEQMFELIQRFNARIKEVATAKGVGFIDLSLRLQGERELFYDGLHFNEHGARVAARSVADFFWGHIFKSN